MIKIKDYKEALTEIIAKVNKESGSVLQINNIPILSPDEKAFSKKIAEQGGLILGGSYPPDDTDSADEDSFAPEYDCLLFLIKKIDLSNITDQELEQFYDNVADLMRLIIDHIRENDFGCDKQIHSLGKFHTEWESNYGGFYGKSVSFTLQ